MKDLIEGRNAPPSGKKQGFHDPLFILCDINSHHGETFFFLLHPFSSYFIFFPFDL